MLEVFDTPEQVRAEWSSSRRRWASCLHSWCVNDCCPHPPVRGWLWSLQGWRHLLHSRWLSRHTAGLSSDMSQLVGISGHAGGLWILGGASGVEVWPYLSSPSWSGGKASWAKFRMLDQKKLQSPRNCCTWRVLVCGWFGATAFSLFFWSLIPYGVSWIP